MESPGSLEPSADKTPDQERPPAHQAGMTGDPQRRKPVRKVPKTLLDMEFCRKIFSRISSEKLAQTEQNEAYRASPGEIHADLTPEIKDCKHASACSSHWDEMTGTERIRICQKCRLHVYDFSNMTLEQAEAVVFQRENKSGAMLYKRTDGKFLSADCPLKLRKLRANIFTAAAAIVVILFLAALSFALYISPKPAATQANKPGARGSEAPANNDEVTVTTRVILPQAQQGQNQSGAGVPAAVPPVGNKQSGGYYWKAGVGETQMPQEYLHEAHSARMNGQGAGNGGQKERVINFPPLTGESGQIQNH